MASDELLHAFMKELAFIQDHVVNVGLSEYERMDNLQDILKSATFETIVKVLLIFDGLASRHLDLDLIGKETKESICAGVQLHDICVDYLDTGGY